MQYENNTLYYIYDPMCSWCYAFEQSLHAIKLQLPTQLNFKTVLGGLALLLMMGFLHLDNKPAVALCALHQPGREIDFQRQVLLYTQGRLSDKVYYNSTSIYNYLE
jgi:hypothetical protein